MHSNLSNDRFYLIVQCIVAALSAALLVFQTFVLSGYEISRALSQFYFLPAAVFCFTLLVYLFHHPIDKQVVLNNRVIMAFLAVAAILISYFTLKLVFYCYKINRIPELMLTLGAAAFLTLLYSVNRYLSEWLRRNFFLKNMVLALTYSITTVALPLVCISAGLVTAQLAAGLFLMRLCFIGALIMPFEINDSIKDKNRNHSNIANATNAITVKLVAACLLFFSLIISYYLFEQNIFRAFLMSGIATLTLIVSYSNNSPFSRLMLLLIDGMMILQPVLIFIA